MHRKGWPPLNELLAELNEYFTVVPDTGSIFVKKKKLSSRLSVGDEVGGFGGAAGYRDIRLCGKARRIATVIWAYYYNSYPQGDVDHENGLPGDDRITNLRDGTTKDNLHNARKKSNNTSGVGNISWSKQARKWEVKFRIKGKQVSLGRFKLFAEAVLCRNAFLEDNTEGYTTRHGS